MPQLPFTPSRNGFAFNNTWHFAESDKRRYQRFLLWVDLICIGFLVKGGKRFGSLAKWGLAVLFQVGLIIAYRQIDLYTFGLCGGMSFTELDYFLAYRPLPLRDLKTHPSKHVSDERQLRAYIWARTLDSLRLNTPRVLTWMFFVHFLPQPLLMRKTRYELNTLKRIIDAGSPWPICLIGTTWSAFRNHQVLAVGYEEQEERISVAVHDSNCPGRLSQIVFDFTSDKLVAWESCRSQRRGPVQAIFCETYRSPNASALNTPLIEEISK